ncbi:Retrovirus-related Pol polyprotein from transposon [Zancudomyces culisetae]|uniref:Retrovirus-related Pol polyprotein from transposon n=1 Tax=Zancudomyces culisetae TaxID=1213189 RepID=A0A1R1PR17_ZANCU|nr:Retrovirus-related Pol polyprotein from transposon [Zancudomyces culisetae]|eukprot:OMH83426.1 Retrovirus-related Pol polyprotein from transposon [Zancudomyces culisetae]
MRKVKYLGHTISAEGTGTCDEKVHAISKMKAPKNIKEVQALLGTTGYYRKYIKDYATIAKPITTLLKKETKWEWGQEQAQALEKLKERLISTPILAHPVWSEKFIITTDASIDGVGAILAQNIEGEERTIEYISRTTNKFERNYSISHLEGLAVIWAIKKFRYYVYGRTFTVRTDHKAILNIFNGKDLIGRIARWAMTLRNYDFNIEHIPGKYNPADGLSRIGQDQEHEVLAMNLAEYFGYIQYLIEGSFPNPQEKNDTEAIRKNAKKYKVEGTKLYKTIKGKWKEVLNENNIRSIIQKIHDETHEGIENTWKRIRIDHSPTTPYRPQSNGQVERLNKVLMNLLRKQSRKDKQNWDGHLWKVLVVLRTMESKSTQFSPSQMLYGTQMTLPNAWETNGRIDNIEEQVKERVKLITTDLPQIRELGVVKAVEAKKWNEYRYNKTLVEQEKSKLEDLWEGPYLVLRKLDKRTYLITDGVGNRDLINGDILKSYHESNFMIPEVAHTIKPKIKMIRRIRRDEGIHA